MIWGISRRFLSTKGVLPFDDLCRHNSPILFVSRRSDFVVIENNVSLRGSEEENINVHYNKIIPNLGFHSAENRIVGRLQLSEIFFQTRTVRVRDFAVPDHFLFFPFQLRRFDLQINIWSIDFFDLH